MEKFLKLFVFLFVVLQGSSVLGFFQSCDMRRCHVPALRDRLAAIDYVPTTEEQLNSLCPPFQEALKCVADQYEECTNKNLFELATSENKTIALMGNLLLNLRRFTTDICDSNSDLRRNYIANIHCFKDLATDPEGTIKCSQEGEAVFVSYAKSLGLLEEGEDEEEAKQHIQYGCYVPAYALACFSVKLQDKCGQVARATLVDLLKLFQPLKWEYCSDINLLNLRTKFFDFLELGDDKRSIYSEVFNSRRRRK
ncbi:uncharacterized protein NPIL_679961 [Nephila pilipes]|uniref:Secreted protein n=1 Tax=Nephila pilipes TaxID=299642 RepID=A0A8X6NRP0_NEPPI|nr:uncharacterized protein NPIL_679961 [Nephila pilipes]